MKSMKLLSEARFLAGEDARGALVILEPGTDLSDLHLDALRECGAAGFVSDWSEAFFERPDEAPALVYDRERHAGLMAFAVAPREGVRLRSWASRGELGYCVAVGDDGALSFAPPPEPARRDRSCDPEIGRDAILSALGAVGVRTGDALLVHSSLSACGRIVGGARTVVEALREAVGEKGHLFFPTFQRSECFLNGAVSSRWDHRPSDRAARASGAVKWVGAIPLEFMRLYPDAPRGAHISHSWAGIGPRAEEILSYQAADEAPFSDNSAPYKVMELLDGKILHFGSPFARTSFMHCLETHYDLPGYSAPGFFQVLREDGRMEWKALPGCFYGRRGTSLHDEESRFFKGLVEEGLRYDRAPLGRGALKLMTCRSFWDAGTRLCRREPDCNLA